MFILRPRPECEVSLLAFSVKALVKGVESLKKRNPGIAKFKPAVCSSRFTSAQLSLVYQCEAPQIQDILGSRVAEKGKKKKNGEQLFGVY